MAHFERDILRRWPRNPIITLEDIPYPCNTVFNGAVAKVGKKYIMLLRVEDRRGHSVVVKAHSEDGYHFVVEKKPCLFPSDKEPFKTYEARGIEDPRIVQVEGTYYVMYTAYSRYGPRIALAKTEDFETYERVSLVSGPGNKDGVLFPEKINGKYTRLDRPIGNKIGNIWSSYSDDLIYWGSSELIAEIRRDYWDSFRIGASVPPIKTEQGWLEIYHGVKMTASGPIYRLGAFLLALDDISNMLGRSEEPILSPREPYERIGDVNNVVFSCGAVVEDDGEIKVYYGAADTCICLAQCTVQEIIDSCLNNTNNGKK